MAVFEALKGLGALLAGFALFRMTQQDILALTTAFIERTHLNPATRYPRLFLEVAAGLHGERMPWIMATAAGYALLRFAEAYGLYRERAWAEVLAAGSAAIYVPFEVVEIIRHPSWHTVVLLALNLLVVAVMVHALRRRRGAAGRPSPDPAR